MKPAGPAIESGRRWAEELLGAHGREICHGGVVTRVLGPPAPYGDSSPSPAGR
jgi:hypothetical protein